MASFVIFDGGWGEGGVSMEEAAKLFSIQYVNDIMKFKCVLNKLEP